MSDVGDRIRKARDKESRERFAARIGVSPGTLYRWEKGKSAPDVNELRAVASETGCDVSWLLHGEVSQPTSATSPVAPPPPRSAWDAWATLRAEEQQGVVLILLRHIDRMMCLAEEASQLGLSAFAEDCQRAVSAGWAALAVLGCTPKTKPTTDPTAEGGTR